MPKKRGLNPKALERIRADRANPPARKSAASELEGRMESPQGRYPGYDTTPAPVRTVEDIANDFGFTYDELLGEPTEPPAKNPRRRVRPTAAANSPVTPVPGAAIPGASPPGGPTSPYFPGNPPPPSPPPPSSSSKSNLKDLSLGAAAVIATRGLQPSPYAPLTWIERQLSPEGREMLYGSGPGIAPMYGYQTRPYAIQSRHPRSPEEVFTSSWRDPNIEDVPSPQPQSASPAQPPSWNGGGNNSPAPPVMRGGNQPASERLGRTQDPLHENTTGTLWGSTHEAAIGTLGGDTHTKATRGFGEPQVESIRAPKPKN